MKVLITGGAGFIGSNFLDYMFHKHPQMEFEVLDLLTYAGNPENFPDEIKHSPRFHFSYGDVCNIELVDDLVGRCDAVVHFAAESHVARSIHSNRTFFTTDVIGTQTVTNAVLRHYSTVDRLIHISTSEVYGTALSAPMTEDHPLNPMSPYAAAKAGADRLVYSYVQTYGIPATIVRPFNQFGPRQHLEKVVPRFITNALKGEPLTVHGDGSAIRDWLYVEDTCRRIEKVLLAPIDAVRGETINLGSGFEFDVLSIAKMVLAMTGRPESLITFIGDRPGQVERHISNTDKQARLLAIDPPTPFETALRDTIAWYDAHRDWWKGLEWMKHVPIRRPDGTIEQH